MILSLVREMLKRYDVNVTIPPKHVKKDITIQLFGELKKGKKTNDVVKNILEDLGDLVEDYELSGPYLNIKVNYNYLFKHFDRMFFFPKKETKIVVEHTSVNPNKALHIGHLRNALLGDVLVRLLRYSGYDVEVHNYIDDTGSQVADIVVGVYYFRFPKTPTGINREDIIKNIQKYTSLSYNDINSIFEDREITLKKLYGYSIPKKLDHYFGDYVYVIVNKLYSLDSSLVSLQKKVLKSIEDKEEPIYSLSKDLTKRILLEQLKTLWNLNIYYNLLVKESDILDLDLWTEAFEKLKELGIVEYVSQGEKEGTWSIDLRKIDYKDTKDKYKVLIRSDGTTVYLAKDIAYAMWKHGYLSKNFRYSIFTKQPNGEMLWETSTDGVSKKFGGADISINVIGIEQKYLQDIISRVISIISLSRKKYIFYGYNHVLLSKNTAKLFGVDSEKDVYKMSGRKGVFINVDNLLSLVEESVKTTLKSRGHKDEYINSVYKRIARSLVAIEILKYDRNKPVIFDIDSMLKIEEGSAIYVLYTYARINSLLKKLDEASYSQLLKTCKFTNISDTERKLLLLIFLYKDKVLSVSESLDINVLVEYLFDIAKTFNEFYQTHPILTEINRLPHRLCLVLMTKKVLENIFTILKIDGVEKI